MGGVRMGPGQGQGRGWGISSKTVLQLQTGPASTTAQGSPPSQCRAASSLQGQASGRVPAPGVRVGRAAGVRGGRAGEEGV